MKSILTFLALLLFPFFISAQIYIDGQPLEEVAEINFVEVCTYQVPMTTKVKATINFGQKMKIPLAFPNENRLTDEEGNSLKFNSYIGVLNLFDENGYEYFGHAGNNEGCDRYLFRKMN